MKKKISLLAIILMLALNIQPAFAAAGDIISVEVGSEEALNSEGDYTAVYTQKVKEDITVITNSNVDHISIGAHDDIEAASVSSDTYTFTYTDYLFTSNGETPIDIIAYDESDVELDDVTVQVFYYDRDRYYSNDNIFKSGSISAFENGLKLTLGKNNFFKDDGADGGMATGDTELEIFTGQREDLDFGLGELSYYSCVSPVYTIEAGDSDSVKMAKPGTLTIKIDAGVPVTQYSKLSIIRSQSGDFNDAELMGGVGNSSGKTITSDPFYYLPGYSYTVGLYNRAINADWAEFSVTPLVAKGFIDENLVDGDGEADNEISRGNFAKMIVKGMGIAILDIPDNPVFTDCEAVDVPDLVTRQCIVTAAAYGIMRGDAGVGADRDFRPNDSLTREEAAVVFANVAQLKLVEDQAKVEASLEKLYDDSDDISDWAQPGVLAVTQGKIMQGEPSADAEENRLSFTPASNLSYSESATMMYNLMKKNKRI